MNHPILVGARWTLWAERSTGAPEAMYATECLTCPATSGWVDNTVAPVGVWALQHTASSGHRQFLATTQRHWRVEPTTVDRAPRAVVTVGVPRRPRGRCPARVAPRGATRVGWLAGPLVIGALVIVSALCGYLLGLDAGCDAG